MSVVTTRGDGGRRRSEARALVRRGTRSSQAVEIPSAKVLREPTICERCGAVYQRKSWRRGRPIDDDLAARATWAACPACVEVSRAEYRGRVLLRGAADASRDAIRRRIENVARRAGFTQPERRLVSIEWTGDEGEVLTTSQKLAHRIVRELTKTFGGRGSYHWSDSDDSLFAVWERREAKA